MRTPFYPIALLIFDFVDWKSFSLILNNPVEKSRVRITIFLPFNPSLLAQDFFLNIQESGKLCFLYREVHPVLLSIIVDGVLFKVSNNTFYPLRFVMKVSEGYSRPGNNVDQEEENAYFPSPKVKEHKASKQNVLKKLDVVQAIEVPSSSNNNNTDTGKGKKGGCGRKKKETNRPPHPPPVGQGGDSDGGDCETNINVE
ncbi:hypothetical protein KY284_035896 [Solanum tuberosum]|nr:hypothetical protein KY284_035896 [Solanum tuberosum]